MFIMISYVKLKEKIVVFALLGLVSCLPPPWSGCAKTFRNLGGNNDQSKSIHLASKTIEISDGCNIRPGSKCPGGHHFHCSYFSKCAKFASGSGTYF